MEKEIRHPLKGDSTELKEHVENICANVIRNYKLALELKGWTFRVAYREFERRNRMLAKGASFGSLENYSKSRANRRNKIRLSMTTAMLLSEICLVPLSILLGTTEDVARYVLSQKAIVEEKKEQERKPQA